MDNLVDYVLLTEIIVLSVLHVSYVLFVAFVSRSSSYYARRGLNLNFDLGQLERTGTFPFTFRYFSTFKRISRKFEKIRSSTLALANSHDLRILLATATATARSSYDAQLPKDIFLTTLFVRFCV